MTASSYYKNSSKQEAAHPTEDKGANRFQIKHKRTIELTLNQSKIMVTPQAATTQAIAVKPEYTDYRTVEQILTIQEDEDFTGRISHHSLQSLEYGILNYLIDGDKRYILTVQQFESGLQAIASKTEPEYSITFTYTREDGVSVDVVMVASGNDLDCRHCWIEETLDDHVYCLETKSGKVVKSHWKNSWNNKWLKAYRKLWQQRNSERVRALEAIARQETDLEEIEYIRSLEAAMYA